MAFLADVGTPPGDEELHDRPPAPSAWLTLAAVNEELVLKGAAHAVDVTKVVDARPAGVDACLQSLDDRGAQIRVLSG